MNTQWSAAVHALARHSGSHLGCGHCLLLRMECQGRIRYETCGEADDLVRELHERRQLAPPAEVADCRWCGFWHVQPAFNRAVHATDTPGVWQLRRGGHRWTVRAVRAPR